MRFVARKRLITPLRMVEKGSRKNFLESSRAGGFFRLFLFLKIRRRCHTTRCSDVDLAPFNGSLENHSRESAAAAKEPWRKIILKHGNAGSRVGLSAWRCNAFTRCTRRVFLYRFFFLALFQAVNFEQRYVGFRRKIGKKKPWNSQWALRKKKWNKNKTKTYDAKWKIEGSRERQIKRKKRIK